MTALRQVGAGPLMQAAADLTGSAAKAIKAGDVEQAAQYGEAAALALSKMPGMQPAGFVAVEGPTPTAANLVLEAAQRVRSGQLLLGFEAAGVQSPLATGDAHQAAELLALLTGGQGGRQSGAVRGGMPRGVPAVQAPPVDPAHMLLAGQGFTASAGGRELAEIIASQQSNLPHAETAFTEASGLLTEAVAAQGRAAAATDELLAALARQ